MKILVLGGGSDQAALIKELQKRGNEVVLLDYLPDCPAKSLVSKHIQASTLDIEAVETAARNESVDLICTACTDQALLTMAYVSEIMRLPCYISYGAALNVTNKRYMKEKLRSLKIPTAPFKVISEYDTKILPNGLRFPVVVKPADCNSSKGVTKVCNNDELSIAIDTALDLSRTKTAIVEQYIYGKEISADLYVYNNQVVLLSTTASIKIKNSDKFTIIGSQFPAVSKKNQEIIRNIGQEIADGFKLNNCPLLVQMLEYDGNFYVIEFSARMGGGSKYHLIKTLSGVDIMSTYVDLVMGYTHTVCPTRCVNYAMMVFVYCRKGTIAKFENFQEAKDKGYISDYFYYKVPGSRIEKAETSSDRAAGYLICADSNEELIRKKSDAETTISILDTVGNDMIIRNLR